MLSHRIKDPCDRRKGQTFRSPPAEPEVYPWLITTTADRAQVNLTVSIAVTLYIDDANHQRMRHSPQVMNLLYGRRVVMAGCALRFLQSFRLVRLACRLDARSSPLRCLLS